MDIRLGSIHVYPFKSMAGVELNSLELDDFGPKHDRRWMLVDGKNSLITQRQQPKMVLIQPEFDGGSIKLKTPGMEELCMPLEADGGKEVTVEIFGDHCVAFES